MEAQRDPMENLILNLDVLESILRGVLIAWISLAPLFLVVRYMEHFQL